MINWLTVLISALTRLFLFRNSGLSTNNIVVNLRHHGVVLVNNRKHTHPLEDLLLAFGLRLIHQSRVNHWDERWIFGRFNYWRALVRLICNRFSLYRLSREKRGSVWYSILWLIDCERRHILICQEWLRCLFESSILDFEEIWEGIDDAINDERARRWLVSFDDLR